MAQKKGSKAQTDKSSSSKKTTKKTTAKKTAKSGSTASRTKKTTKKSASKKKTASKTAAASSNGNRSRTTAASSPRTAGTQSNGDSFDQAPTTEQLRKVKTGLTKRDLESYRKLLLEKRAELVGDMESLKADARGSGEGISYEHMADVGTDSYEQEFTLGLVESERRMLEEIDEALSRIEDGTYGVCLESAEPISRVRLEAKPWAKYTIEVEREREKRGL